MTGKYNNFEVSFSSLPSEILCIILKQVDWKTIYNVKALSKFFYTFVAKNLDSLPKPKVREFEISSYATKDTIIEGFFLLENKINPICISCQVNNLSQSDKENEIENCLMRIDLTNVGVGKIKTNGKSFVFDILNRYLQPGINVGFLEIEINRCQNLESFSSFIQKIKHVTFFHLTKLCFSHQTILKCQCTKFVNPEMITKLFLNNNNLQWLDISSKCSDFDVELIQNMKTRQILCEGEGKLHKNFTICLPYKRDMDVHHEITKHFSCGKYIISNISQNYGNFNYFQATKLCTGCNCQMHIGIAYINIEESRKPICSSYV
ncbi:F-box domain-containing protein [Strongyloides ratti]|uniref:F-box domain-containing protein n=1 Tax=Strongyloides ratti TaxID=34506 RepID=A0A090L1K5_STRRB|nr:F-box domain-containing protein [Strongyloides ratti]CEF62002.1 F-box domain-containing protein [Strongyloides ratti]